MSVHLKKYWFTGGLPAVVILALADGTNTVAGAGRWLVAHHGADIVIFLIFLISGLCLETDQLKRGLADFSVLLVSLLVIFVISPVIALALARVPLATGVRIGLFLVAIMPTTLSSGVVMTAAAGGNMATALLITIVANSLAIFIIPMVLPFFFDSIGSTHPLDLDRLALMLKIASLVVVPLLLGLLLRLPLERRSKPPGTRLSLVNQTLVLIMVGMATSQSKPTIITSLGSLPIIGLLAFFYHGMLVGAAFLLARFARMQPGRREAVIFMGGQKTLTLAILIQMRFFPQFGEALVFNVGHHLVHLMMDGFLVAWLTAAAGRRNVPAREAGPGRPQRL